MTTENLFGETIYSYSRTQAIDDGVLVDLNHVDSIRQHCRAPACCELRFVVECPAVRRSTTSALTRPPSFHRSFSR